VNEFVNEFDFALAQDFFIVATGCFEIAL